MHVAEPTNTIRCGQTLQNHADQNDKWDPEIRSVHYRAQDVKPGGLFVAIQGLVADGHDFIDEALARGASAIVMQKKPRPFCLSNGELSANARHDRKGDEYGQEGPIIIAVVNTRKALAALSSRFFDDPSEKLVTIGITGTNGKTTTAFLLEHILAKAGFNVGVIGTSNYRYAGKTYKNPMTTPESLDLQRILSDMFNTGITHVVMEVTSHAIDLFRVHSCSLDIGVFTNLSQDHLDYHGDMNSYWSCKKSMFTHHLNSGPKKDRATAVINCDDAKGKELHMMLAMTTLTTGRSEDNLIRPKNFHLDLTGITGEILTPTGAFEFRSPLAGKHNLENILCAAGAGIALNLPLTALKDGIESVTGVPGRLERIPNDVGRHVYVDYAHSPDALKNVLSFLRSMTGGRIICIFGCGGNRDRDKRPQMGKIAGNLSDLAIITSDNPRTEEPMNIIDQVLLGMKKAIAHSYSTAELETGFQKQGYAVEPDRKKSIQLGIMASRPGDTVLVAGKGDETYQIIGDKTIPFDDRKVAEMALRSCL